MAEPYFALDGNVITIGFPTGNTRYRLNPDHTGSFGNEQLIWFYETDPTLRMGVTSGYAQTRGFMEELSRDQLLTLTTYWSNGQKMVLYRVHDGSWMISHRDNSTSYNTPTFSGRSNQFQMTLPNVATHFVFNDNGAGTFGNETFSWTFCYIRP